MSNTSIITMVVGLIVLAIINGLRISFNPFKVTFSDWDLFIAVILFIISVIIFRVNEHSKAYAKGLRKGQEMTIETLEEIVKETVKNQTIKGND